MNKIICDGCEKEIKPGNTNGMPNGVGFQLKCGETLTLCQDCLIEIGRMYDKKEGDAN